MHHITEHISKRCQQRGIKERDLTLVTQFGTETPRGVILTGKDIARVEREAKRLIDRLSRLRNVFVATDEETMITVYRARKQQRRGQVRNW